MRFDLHMHTHFSDGKYAPSEVVKRAKNAGISGISVTDHDTVEGAAAAAEACALQGMDFILGVEISAAIEGEEIHMLAFDFEKENLHLSELLASQRLRRAKRGEEFIRVLRLAGVSLPPGDELDVGGEGTLGRPHIAKLLVDSGSVSTMNEAFEKYLRPGVSTFVPKSFPDVSHVVQMIRAAGGLSVLAHPGHHTSHNQLLTMLEMGLDGFEVYHPSHDKSLQHYYRTLSEELGVVTTGGSDYHGTRPADDDNLGNYYTTATSKGNLFGPRTL